MTLKMESSAELEKPVTTADKNMGAIGVTALDEAGQDVFDDSKLFCRERQLILLSALFKLYGIEWEESPDWIKVAEEIKSANIPVFGENFAPETCETFYKSLMEHGYQVGMGQYSVLLRAPGKLSEGEKRLWILAKTSADLSFTSERLDQAFREAYKEEYETLQSLYTGNSDIKSQAVADALEVSSESGSDKGDKEEYEDPEAAKVAAELKKAELNKGILGFNDFLVMIQYCNDAAEHATKALPQFEASLKQSKALQKITETITISSSPEPTPKKPGELATEQDLDIYILPTPPKSTTSTPIVERERTAKCADSTPSPPSASSSSDDSPDTIAFKKLKESCKSPVKKTQPKPVQIGSPDLIEIDVSPDKSLMLMKANNKDKTVVQESSNATKDNCDPDPVAAKCSGDNGKEPEPTPLATVTNVNMVGTGQEANDKKGAPPVAPEPAKDTLAKEPPRKEPPVKEKPEVIEILSSPEENEGKGPEKGKESAAQPVVPSGEVVNTPKSIPTTSASEGKESNVGDDLNKTASSENSDIVEIFPENDKDDKKQDEGVGKEKGQGQGQGNKKKESGSTARSTRTSSRLTSPEPSSEQVQQNEEGKSTNIKKTTSRQSSSQQQPVTESPPHTPALRSRRGATPTKAVEVVVVGDSPIEAGPVTRSVTPSKAGPPVAASTPAPPSTEDTEEETFETPRSTPESTEMGKTSDVETSTKPLKPVKVYSVKPPSPLSQVDPRLLDEFIDDEDEDAELVEIDSNVNKAKGLKGSSPSKGLSLRGRTVSSENASDAGGQTNEDSAPCKRVARKLNEDAEEDGASNTEEGESKRLTRSSLKLHDAANEESTEAPQTESEKAASESSFGGKEKKPRTSKQLLRVKKLHDEKNRFYGEDNEESPDGKRLTRAQRARTSTSSTSIAEKRSKPPSVGDSEGLSESEPTPTRATRSRSSTTTNTPAPVRPTPSSSQSQISTVSCIDDEEQKNLRKSLFSLYEKLTGSEAATSILKSLQDDQSLVSKWNVDMAQIKKNVEQGKGVVNISSFYFALNLATINIMMRLPNSNALQEAAEMFSKLVQTSIEELKTKPEDPPQPKNDNSDVESLESHDEQRSETSSSTKQTPAGGGGGVGGRRKRKRSASETSEEVLIQENKRRVTRTSTSSSSAYNSSANRKTKHPISPDIVSANRVRH